MSSRGRFCRKPAEDRNRKNPKKRSAQAILARAGDTAFRFQGSPGNGEARLNKSSSLGFRKGVLDGFELNCGRKTFSRRTAFLARCERSERLACLAEQATRRIVPLSSGLAAQAL